MTRPAPAAPATPVPAALPVSPATLDAARLLLSQMGISPADELDPVLQTPVL